MSDKSTPMPPSREKQYFVPVSLIMLGIILAVMALLLFVREGKTRPKPPSNVLQSSAAPSSKKPSLAAVSSYNVAPDLPKYVTIPSINISKTRIIQLGLMKNDQIAVPDNIYDTGWYDGSAKPGQNGAMFIYGHVSSWTADGVFYNLKKLKPGDKVIITRGDNATFTYQVVSSRVYSYDNIDMSQVLAPIDSNKPGLNLMTCTGQVIKGTSEFNERLVVFTSLVSS